MINITCTVINIDYMVDVTHTAININYMVGTTHTVNNKDFLHHYFLLFFIREFIIDSSKTI